MRVWGSLSFTILSLCATTRCVLSFQPPHHSRHSSNHPSLSVLQKRTRGAIVGSGIVTRYSMGDDERQSSSERPSIGTTFGSESVPEAQRPANEYIDLMNSPLFDWASEDTGSKGLAIRLAAVYAVFFGVVCYPIAGATFTQDGYMLQKLAAANVGALLVIVILLLRLYSGWGYVGARLNSKVIEYEETGWYDGDIEYKTEAEKARDLFLYRSDVKPVVDRLKAFTGAMSLLWILACAGLNTSMAAKPMFNQYDPDILEKLVYDDKLAGVAADQSNGRPSYCDSRYYRAVANGGQGCDR